MENITYLLALLSMAGLVLGLLGIIKGNLKFLRLHGRKKNGLLLLASIVLFFVAVGLTPSNANSNTQDSITTTDSSPENVEQAKLNIDNSSVNQDAKTVNAPVDQSNASRDAKNENVNQKVSVNSNQQQPKGELKVHFIDVGQGASQLIIGSTGKTMLIDAGNNNKEKLIVDYLKKENIKKIDILIGTHPDADHIGGLDAVINNFDIGKFYMPNRQSNTKTFEDVLRAVQNKGLKISTAKAGLTLDWEDNTEVKMVAPIGEYNDNNDMSTVVHLKFGNTSFLFTGDAETKSENDIIKSGENIKSDVLLIGHHGSKSSTSQAFLDTVKPTYAVIQVGKDNNYGHPTDEVLKRLNDKGIKIYRNDLQGNIVFISDGKELKVNVERNTSPDKQNVPQNQSENKSSVNVSEKNESSLETIVAKAYVDNKQPKQNTSVSVTVEVKDDKGNPVSGADVSLSLKYKSTTTEYSGITGKDGKSVISFKIGRATKDYTVNGNIVVKYDDKVGNAKISFTPQ